MGHKNRTALVVVLSLGIPEVKKPQVLMVIFSISLSLSLSLSLTHTHTHTELLLSIVMLYLVVLSMGTYCSAA
jgi:hypothetical protein